MNKKRVSGVPRKKFVRLGTFYVYIVECADRTYYIGFTPDLANRVKLHNNGKGAKYTRDRRPVRLVWSKEYRRFKPAFLMEKRLKRLKRKHKEALVRGVNLAYVLKAAKSTRRRGKAAHKSGYGVRRGACQASAKRSNGASFTGCEGRGQCSGTSGARD